ncbi:unnamed protein product [Leptosia nina]|uniref:Uncharacterized protein n=1 Tax=Leptosia nina TaxID=320188 RepID=A0AAV1JZD6_9NEOP
MFGFIFVLHNNGKRAKAQKRRALAPGTCAPLYSFNKLIDVRDAAGAELKSASSTDQTTLVETRERAHWACLARGPRGAHRVLVSCGFKYSVERRTARTERKLATANGERTSKTTSSCNVTCEFAGKGQLEATRRVQRMQQRGAVTEILVRGALWRVRRAGRSASGHRSCKCNCARLHPTNPHGRPYPPSPHLGHLMAT